MEKAKKNIAVTKTFLPDLEEYVDLLKGIWEKEWITNNGACLQLLEKQLSDFLNSEHVVLTNNGTTALQIAIKAFDLKGKIITTPFSYVATTSSIVWENCEPVFADIDPVSLTIDTEEIRKKIQPGTEAILATHVYGNPCDVEAIETIAKEKGLRVIYDAAHCFGVDYLGKSLMDYGDLSVLSFHATKIFHTVEGGAVLTSDRDLSDKLAYLRNFGHNGEEEFHGLGINGKMSELHAAMGLLLMKHFPEIRESRKKVCDIYDAFFAETSAAISCLKWRGGASRNYAYYPILFSSEDHLIRVKKKMNDLGIMPRRYFYPPLHELPYVKSDKMPVTEDVSRRALCLPLYYGLSEEDQKEILSLITE